MFFNENENNDVKIISPFNTENHITIVASIRIYSSQLNASSLIDFSLWCVRLIEREKNENIVKSILTYLFFVTYVG